MKSYCCVVKYLDNYGNPAEHETHVDAPDEATADKVARRRVARRWASYFKEVVSVEITERGARNG